MNVNHFQYKYIMFFYCVLILLIQKSYVIWEKIYIKITIQTNTSFTIGITYSSFELLIQNDCFAKMLYLTFVRI